jgi:hypothetical protein
MRNDKTKKEDNMTKKKNSLISIIPAFLLMGAAVGVQTKNVIMHSLIGLTVGVVV